MTRTIDPSYSGGNIEHKLGDTTLRFSFSCLRQEVRETLLISYYIWYCLIDMQNAYRLSYHIRPIELCDYTKSYMVLVKRRLVSN